MKKWVCLMISLVMMVCLTVGRAEEAPWTDEEVKAYLAKYSTDELLRLKTLLENELEIRGSGEATLFTYVLNTSSHKFHLPSCSSVSKMKEKNKKIYEGNREDLIDCGYEPCGNCNP